jgi:hypothetical protein
VTQREFPFVRSVGLRSGQYTNLSAGVDVITRPVAGPDSGCSVVGFSGSGSSGSDPKSNS